MFAPSGQSPLASGLLCTREGGCSCNGKPLDTKQVPKGSLFVGWQRGVLAVQGSAIADECKKEGKPEEPKPPKNDACQVLSQAGVQSTFGVPGFFLSVLDVSKSTGHVSICGYGGGTQEAPTGKGAQLTLTAYHKASAARAWRNLINSEIKAGGLHRIKIAGADVAGFGKKNGAEAVEMAIGRNGVIMNAGSKGQSATISFAARIAGVLR
jgi:hypothetical protein